MMRSIVMAQIHAVQETETDVADRIAEHERADARRVALESRRDHVHHQPAVLLMARGLLRRGGFRPQLNARLPLSLFALRSPFHALFDRAHNREILVESRAVGRA